MKRITIAAVIALVAVGAAACGGDDAGRPPATTAPAASTLPVDPSGAACPVGDADCYETGAPVTSVDPAGAACPVGDADCYETGAPIAVGEPSIGMCARDVTDCNDMSLGEDRCLPEASGCVDTAGDEFPLEAERQAAQGLLGRYEPDLGPDVVVVRRGAESLPFPADHVPGRTTVELDDTDGSGYRVVIATVELPAGSVTYELQPG